MEGAGRRDHAVKATMEANKARGVQVVGDDVSECRGGERGHAGRGGVTLTLRSSRRSSRSGGEVYNRLCISCHAPDGTGVPLLELKTTHGAAARRARRV